MFIIFMVALIALSICIWRNIVWGRRQPFCRREDGWMMGTIGTGIAAFVLGMLSFVPLPMQSVPRKKVSYPLVALHMDQSQPKIEGTFFLGCGSISSGSQGRYFWWYEQWPDGAAAYQHEACDRTVVFQDGGCHVTYYRSQTIWSWVNGFVESGSRWRYIEFHVPEDSIFETIKFQ